MHEHHLVGTGEHALVEQLEAHLATGIDAAVVADAAAEQHRRPGPREVIAASAVVDARRAAKLAHPDHQRIVQQTALVQIVQERRQRLVKRRQQVLLQVDECPLVRVPRLLVAEVHLDHPHASFEQAGIPAVFLHRGVDPHHRQPAQRHILDHRRLVARRIVGFVAEGEALQPGQRVGLIRFGSRCDVYLPAGTAALVLEGQRSIGGETVLADLAGDQTPRQGRTS